MAMSLRSAARGKGLRLRIRAALRIAIGICTAGILVSDALTATPPSGVASVRGHNRDGPMIVEQQAHLAERDGLIDWMRIVCSGQRAPT